MIFLFVLSVVRGKGISHIMRNHFVFLLCFGILFLWGAVGAQVYEEEDLLGKERTLPRVIDFSKMFEREKLTQEDFEEWKRKRETRLKERLSHADALERAVNPQAYVVGPGDVFSFNIWGGMEMQLPVTVSPEGILLVPSVGAIEVDGETLVEVQKLVLDAAAPRYKNSEVTLTLESLRFFRVHVVGEVKFPGTYIAQAVDRISGLIVEAGGVTDWAWKRKIELRQPNGEIDIFDLDLFEREGNLEQDLFVNGGDVIYVPPLDPGQCLMEVEGDLENSGMYHIFPGERILAFLQRIQALRRNADLSRIVVIRSEVDENTEFQEKQFITPFGEGKSFDLNFPLQCGDRVVLPSRYVYVKGTVRLPGAYPYSMNMTAKDYAGMAGGDFRSGSIKGVKVLHVRTGETEKGPNVVVEPGDIVQLNPTWNQRLDNYLRFIPTITSLILAAKAAGVFGD